MIKNFCAVFVCLLSVSGVHADIITSLDLPASGNYTTPLTVTSMETYMGATFDIVYTVTAVSNDTGALVGSSGTAIGVGSDNDVNPQHYTTIEGDGSAGANGSTAGGEGLSFTSLAITNFQSNGSTVVAGDITNLRFDFIEVSAVGNNQDGANVSYTDFVTSTANVNLAGSGTGGANVYEIPLTTLANYDATATDLYISPDNIASSNRWNVSGLSVEYDVPVAAVPEPSSLAVISLGMILVSRRRRR